MPSCVRCNAELPPGALYCAACGAAVHAAPAPQAPAPAAGAPPQGVTEGVAIIALLLNVFVLPGIGSLIAQRREGWYQLGLAVFAFIFGPLAFAGAFLFGFAGGDFGPSFPVRFFAPFLLIPIAVLAGLAAWIWGIVTGIDVLRQAQAARTATYR